MSDIMLYGVLRMPYELAMSDEISRLQFYQRVQEAVDRLEACETTNTPRQAASIADDDKLHSLIEKFARQSSGCSCVHCDESRMVARREIFAYIDAKLAQASDDWRDRANILEARLGEVMEKRDEWQARAEKAEAVLSMKAASVPKEGMSALALKYIEALDNGMREKGHTEQVRRDMIVLMLETRIPPDAPQSQSATSGLPG